MSALLLISVVAPDPTTMAAPDPTPQFVQTICPKPAPANATSVRTLQHLAGHQGWVGVYHAAHGKVADGFNSSAWDVGAWGIVAPESAPSDGNFTFAQDIEFHCNQVK